MATTYKIPMKKIILVALLAFVAAVAAAVTWSFRSGFMWSAICLIAVAGPLSVLYWYMLYINPRRASITVADEGVLLAAPPFASAVIPWAAVLKSQPVSLTDEAYTPVKNRKVMHFGGYRSGIVELKGGKEAVIVANRPDALCLETEDRFYLLGPDDLEGFIADVDAVMSQK